MRNDTEIVKANPLLAGGFTGASFIGTSFGGAYSESSGGWVNLVNAVIPGWADIPLISPGQGMWQTTAVFDLGYDEEHYGYPFSCSIYTMSEDDLEAKLIGATTVYQGWDPLSVTCLCELAEGEAVGAVVANGDSFPLSYTVSLVGMYRGS